MAEFAEVMRQAHRMCDVCKCDDCPMADHVDMCGLIHSKYRKEGILLEFERIVMQWAKEHPEPQYPTWEEWQQEHFRDGANMIRPCEFMSRADAHCFDYMDTYGCRDCANQPIPADIAEKLGVKPKEADHEKC